MDKNAGPMYPFLPLRRMHLLEKREGGGVRSFNHRSRRDTILFLHLRKRRDEKTSFSSGKGTSTTRGGRVQEKGGLSKSKFLLSKGRKRESLAKASPDFLGGCRSSSLKNLG